MALGVVIVTDIRIVEVGHLSTLEEGHGAVVIAVLV